MEIESKRKSYYGHNPEPPTMSNATLFTAANLRVGAREIEVSQATKSHMRYEEG
jgi:hypothetical protein